MKSITRKIIQGLSLTSVLFVFQACYGTAQDFGLDVFIEGQVLSKTTGLPIEGIKVSIADDVQYEVTDKDGMFALYTYPKYRLRLLFQDIDSEEKGHNLDKDTILTELREKMYLNIALDEK